MFRDGQQTFPAGYEGETPWHYSWKHLVKDDCCEVVLGPNREHRADIVGSGQTIVELQHSPIDSQIARERTAFYETLFGKRVVWLIDAFDYAERIKLAAPCPGEKYGRVMWNNQRLWVRELAADLRTHVYLDPKYVSDMVMKIWAHKNELYGFLLSKRAFFMKHLASVAKPEYVDFSFKRYDVWRIYND